MIILGNVFLFLFEKVLWVLIRNLIEALLMSTHMFLCKTGENYSRNIIKYSIKHC